MFILGINSAYHESSACLLHDGRIVAAVEEERFNRVKHAKQATVRSPAELPWAAIAHCLARGGIAPAEVGHIGYSLDPEARRRLNLDLPDGPTATPGDFGTAEGEETFYRSNLEAGRLLRERFPRAEVHFIEHHLCHAASAYTVSPFDEAAILAVDGIGEFYSTWLGVGRGAEVEVLHRVPYPHSLGFLWEKMSELLGFDRYSGPGKMMGYGAITDPLGELSGKDHLSTMRELVHPEGELSFFVDPQAFSFRNDDFGPLERRFGPRRPAVVDRYEEASVAAALQTVTEDVLVHLCQGLHARLGGKVDALCLAGGVALNCVANDKLLRRTPFKELWIQPAANDAGTAVGAAAYLHCQVLGLGGRPRMAHAFTGPEYDEEQLAAALERAGLSIHREEDVARYTARCLDRGEIVAWFQGAQEFGPRALGHRSILADPTRFDTRSRINSQVKLRESFRPFAPSVLDSAVERYFDLPAGAHAADYMLLAPPLSDDRYSQVIPAVVQENGSTHRSTSRLHRVREAENPLYHRLIGEFRAISGIGAVLNTSFNINEPIVTSPEQAIATFGASGMDRLVLGPFVAEQRR